MTQTLDRDAVVEHFHAAVNMTASQLDRWLDSDDSKAVGWKGEDGDGPEESIGHESGRRIVKLLGTKKADLTDDDLHHMQKAAGLCGPPHGPAAGEPRGVTLALQPHELGP